MHFLEHLKTLERALFLARADKRAIDPVCVVVFRGFGHEVGELHNAEPSMARPTCVWLFQADLVDAAEQPRGFQQPGPSQDRVSPQAACSEHVPQAVQVQGNP